MDARVIRSNAASVEVAAGFTPSGELHASHEAWGLRRVFVQAPDGNVINIVNHHD
jgi:hypothetical protein